jgi:hypothetical protein
VEGVSFNQLGSKERPATATDVAAISLADRGRNARILAPAETTIRDNRWPANREPAVADRSSVTNRARKPWTSGRRFGVRPMMPPLVIRDLPTTVRTKSRFTGFRWQPGPRPTVLLTIPGARLQRLMKSTRPASGVQEASLRLRLQTADFEGEGDRALGGSARRVLSNSPDGHAVRSGMGPSHGRETESVARGCNDCCDCACPSLDCCDQE